MRGETLLSYIFSLLIHFFLISLLISWTSSLCLKKEKREFSIPVELSWEVPSQPKLEKLNQKGSSLKERKVQSKRKKEVQRTQNFKVKPKKKLKKVSKVKRKLTRKLTKREVSKLSSKKSAFSKIKEKNPIKRKVESLRGKAPEPKRDLLCSKPANEPEGNALGSSKKKKEVQNLEAKGSSKEGNLGKRSSFNPQDYRKLVISTLNKNKFYPPLARRLGIEGRVELRITFNRKGEPIKVEVLNSPHFVLKKAAVKLIKKSSFPPLPEDYPEDTLTLKVAIVYRLVD